MDIQRLRNLTTLVLHTEIGHVYQDIEHLVGVKGIMTHMLPRAGRALEPLLRARLTDARFWDGRYDPTHTGELPVDPLNEAERRAFWDAYKAEPDPLAGKSVIAVSAE